MDIRSLILKKLAKKGEVRAKEIVAETKFSRAYINRFFKELQDEGRLLLVGRANQAFYVSARKARVLFAKQRILCVRRLLHNKNLSEDVVLDEIKQDSGIFLELPKHIAQILDYSFTEMLNNAIDHSRSKTIGVVIKRTASDIRFDITDRGVGIFNNIMRKKKLKNELEAIQDLTKGKQTTAPEAHSGEGIFFTSRVADILTFRSSVKKLIFHTMLQDIFVRDIKKTKGTAVTCVISLTSKKRLSRIFKKYSGKSFEFGKTKVRIKLFMLDTEYLSRSQARRVVSGLEEFKEVVLDFHGVDFVGQAFADEVFRVWQANHRSTKIEYEHANKNIRFMIQRAVFGGTP